MQRTSFSSPLLQAEHPCSLSIPARAGAEGGRGAARTLAPDTVTQMHGRITQFATLNRNTSGAPGWAAALSWWGQAGRVSSS